MSAMTMPHLDRGRARRLPPGDPERLIAEYAPAIRHIAQRVATRLPPYLAVEDLIHVGVLGLMAASGKYDPTRDHTFSRYARCCIQGAMLDELRRRDWRPRSIQEHGKAITRAAAELERQLGRAPAAEEVATRLGIPLDTFYQWCQQVYGGSLLSLDTPCEATTEETFHLLDVVAMDEAQDPETLAQAQQRRERLAHAIDALSQQEKTVLSLYYYEDLAMHEIGEVLQLSESRVSQIHKKALAQLRPMLTELLDA